MLIRFNVKNYLSFFETDDGKSNEFSMIAGKTRSKKSRIYDDKKINLLKFSAIYGANASGKSNLIKAMNFMQSTVFRGKIRGSSEDYCRTSTENKTKPSYFEMEILLNNKYYAYGFEAVLNENKIISEWLYELNPNKEDKKIFVRDLSKASFEFSEKFSDGELGKKLKLYAEDIKDDGSILLLTMMNKNKKNFYTEHNKAIIFKDLFVWIINSLDINYPDVPISGYNYLSDKSSMDSICKWISAFGTGISGYQISDISFDEFAGKLNDDLRKKLTEDIEKQQLSELDEKKQLKKATITLRGNKDLIFIEILPDGMVCKKIQFSHNNEEDILYGFSEESDGTIRLFDLLEILIGAENKTYIIDELDRCLHPALTYKFIEQYLLIADKKNIQLIVTTHESRLLDFDLLRRDEVWFVEKNIRGESCAYSLEEYNARFDQKIDKAYLDGRYGGVPVFNTIFPIGDE